MQVDIVSDTICPWCFIGKRRFESALRARPALQPKIRWRPFQLNPKMPDDGMDRHTYVATKFGGEERAAEFYRNIAAAARTVGVEMAFDRIRRTPNTLNSHRLIRWAATAGVQDAVVELLFSRYFLEGQDIGDHGVLTDVAGKAGMDAALVGELLAGDADRQRIVAEDIQAREIGIAGVPYFIFDQKFAVSGAQDPAVFLQVFDRLAETGNELATAPD